MEHEELPQDIADTLGLTDAQSTTANPMFFGIYPLYSIAVTQRDAISIKGTRHRLELKPTWIFNMLDGIQLGIQGQFDDTLCVALKCATLQC